MNATKLLTAMVAALVLIGGVAAVGAAAQGDAPMMNDAVDAQAADNGDGPGDAPDDAGNGTDADNASQGPAANSSDNPANASENAANVSEDRPGEVGPPGGLPDHVPDHVQKIHDTIVSFLNDDEMDNLGLNLHELLSDETPVVDADGADASDDGDEEVGDDKEGDGDEEDGDDEVDDEEGSDE